MSNSRNKGLSRLRELRQETEAVEVDMEAQRARFVKLARSDSAPKAVSSFQLFQTPADTADGIVNAIVQHYGTIDGLRILEPSAGLGRIYKAIRRASLSAFVVLVEQSADCCGELYRLIEADANAQLIQADFLTVDAERIGGPVDAVAMNPPFTRGADRAHCNHASGLTKPNGLVSSLCYNGVQQNKKIKPLCSSWEVLPADTFKAEGTRASVVKLAIET